MYLSSIQQTEDLKEIAMKMAKLPKVNESRPRTVVITHGKEPAIVVKGTATLTPSFFFNPLSPDSVACEQIVLSPSLRSALRIFFALFPTAEPVHRLR